MKAIVRKIDNLGRVVLPIDFRRAIGLDKNRSVTINVEADTITIRQRTDWCRLCGEALDSDGRAGLCPGCIGRIKGL